MPNAMTPEPRQTTNLPRKSMMSPTMLTVATLMMFLTRSAKPFHAEVQKDVPSMAVMMYALRFNHSMHFCKYHKQYST